MKKEEFVLKQTKFDLNMGKGLASALMSKIDQTIINSPNQRQFIPDRTLMIDSRSRTKHILHNMTRSQFLPQSKAKA